MAGRERKLIKLNDETGAAPGRAVAVEEEKGEGGEDSVIAELPERPRRQRRRRAGQRPPEGLMVPIINQIVEPELVRRSERVAGRGIRQNARTQQLEQLLEDLLPHPVVSGEGVGVRAKLSDVDEMGLLRYAEAHGYAHPTTEIVETKTDRKMREQASQAMNFQTTEWLKLQTLAIGRPDILLDADGNEVGVHIDYAGAGYAAQFSREGETVLPNFGRRHKISALDRGEIFDPARGEEFLRQMETGFDRYNAVVADMRAAEAEEEFPNAKIYFNNMLKQFSEIFAPIFARLMLNPLSSEAREEDYDHFYAWEYLSQALGDALDRGTRLLQVLDTPDFYQLYTGIDTALADEVARELNIKARLGVVRDAAVLLTTGASMETVIYDRAISCVIAWSRRLPLSDNKRVLPIADKEEFNFINNTRGQDATFTTSRDYTIPLSMQTQRGRLLRLGFDYLLHKRVQSMLLYALNHFIREQRAELVFNASILFSQLNRELWHDGVQNAATRIAQAQHSQEGLFGAMIEFSYFQLERAVWNEVRVQSLALIRDLALSADTRRETADQVRTLTAPSTAYIDVSRVGGAARERDLFAMQVYSASFGSFIDQGTIHWDPALYPEENEQPILDTVEQGLAQHNVTAVHQIVLLIFKFIVRAFQRLLFPGAHQIPAAVGVQRISLREFIPVHRANNLLAMNIAHSDLVRRVFYMEFIMVPAFRKTQKRVQRAHAFIDPIFPDFHGDYQRFWDEWLMPHTLTQVRAIREGLRTISGGDPELEEQVKQRVYNYWMSTIRFINVQNDNERAGIIRDTAVPFENSLTVRIGIPEFRSSEQLYQLTSNDLRDTPDVFGGRTHRDFVHDLNSLSNPDRTAADGSVVRDPRNIYQLRASARSILRHHGILTKQWLNTQNNVHDLLTTLLDGRRPVPLGRDVIEFTSNAQGEVEIVQNPIFDELRTLLYETVYIAIKEGIADLEDRYQDDEEEKEKQKLDNFFLHLESVPVNYTVSSVQLTAIAKPAFVSRARNFDERVGEEQRENIARLRPIYEAMRLQAYAPHSVEAQDANRYFQYGTVNYYFTVYDFPGEIFMRYAYPFLNQKIFRRYPCTWVMVLTIIHIVETGFDVASNAKIRLRHFRAADRVAARAAFYGTEIGRARTDFSISQHLNYLHKYFGVQIEAYRISLLAPALRKEFILGGNDDILVTNHIQFITFAQHIALARTHITPSLTLRERVHLGRSRKNYQLTPLGSRKIFNLSETRGNPTFSLKREMMDRWDATGDTANTVLQESGLLAEDLVRGGTPQSAHCIDIYFDVETTNGAEVRCQVFMLAYKLDFFNYSMADQDFILHGDTIKREDLSDEGDVQLWFVADILFPIYQRNLELWNASPASNSPLKRPPPINVYAHNGSRFDTLFLLPYIYSFWPTGTQPFGEIRDMRYLTAGSNNIYFIDTWRAMGGGSLDFLAKEFNCVNRKGDTSIVLRLRTIEQYDKLPEAEKEEIRLYNRLDVAVLHEVYTKFKKFYVDMLKTLLNGAPQPLQNALGDGSHLFKPTFAATSLLTWKLLLFPPLLDLQPQLDERLYAIEQLSYQGAITAVYDHRHHEIDKDGAERIVYLDVNSLYPSCMTGPFPTTAGCLSLIGSYDSETVLTLQNVVQDDLYAISYYDHKGLKQCFIPRKLPETTIYPDCEDLLAGTGYRDPVTGVIADLANYPAWIDKTCVWVWGLTIAAALSYQPAAVFKAVVRIRYPVQHRIFKRIEDFYAARMAHKGTAMDTMLKLGMNSVYGKLAQKQYDEKIYTAHANLPFDPSKNWLKQGKDWDASAEKCLWEAWFGRHHQDNELRAQINPEIIQFPPLKAIRFMPKLNMVEATLNIEKNSRITNSQGLVSIASKVTAMARNIFISMVLESERAGWTPIYGDTDSIVIRGPKNQPLPFGGANRVVWREPWERDPRARGGVNGISEALGDLKIEHELTEFQAFAPKFYCFYPHTKTKQFVCKCKGNKMGHQENQRRFAEQMRQTSAARNVQLQWIRLDGGEPTVFQHEMRKSTTVHPKRFVLADGKTRPFHNVEEYKNLRKRRLNLSSEGGQIIFSLV